VGGGVMMEGIYLVIYVWELLNKEKIGGGGITVQTTRATSCLTLVDYTEEGDQYFH